MFKPYDGGTKHRASECNGAMGAIQDALYVLNGKWKIPIIVALSEGNKRFGELQRAVTGIAPKVLSHELKMLELNGFVMRHVYDTIPVTVEYELLEYSNSLDKVIEALREWGSQHRSKLKSESRKRRQKTEKSEAA
ncbi:MAG: helix-turn-helix transcriptional regulator [Bacteroidetes bacterium]|nr:helix-turn-helix transcriptional regulator [Bacteroidota bacterium]